MSDDLPEAPPALPEDALKERRRANMAKARAARGKNRAPAVNSPEFAEAVQAAAAEAAQRIVAELLAKQAIEVPAADHSPTGDLAWARSLATAMAEVADQGSGRAQARVPAEEMARRNAARERMMQLLIGVRARGVRPLYQLRDKVELDVHDNGRYAGRAIVEPIWVGTDRLHYPTEIEYDEVPNEAMIPLDDEAKAIYAAFMESIGSPAYDAQPLAVTHGGAVIRGGAATALFASTAGHLGARPGETTAATGAATIRRHQPSLTKSTNVLGTLHPAVRENA